MPELFAYGTARLTPAELEIIAEIFSASRQAQDIPDDALCRESEESCRDNLRDFFVLAVADMASHYRAAIPHGAGVATTAETIGTIKKIAKLARNIERDADALDRLLSSLDERSHAAMHAYIPGEPPADALLIEVAAWLGVRSDRMRALTKLAEAVRRLYPQKLSRGPNRAVAAHRAGGHVKALFQRFGIPYAVTEARGTSKESHAVLLFKIVTGIDERADTYLS